MCNRKKTFALLLCFLFLLSCRPAKAAIIDKPTQYTESIQAFRECLGGEDSYELAIIASWFEDLGNYEHSFFYFQYIQVLLDTENGQYTAALSKINRLKSSAAFAASLEENGLPSVQELEYYVTGRKAEGEKDFSAAVAAYNHCPDFCDSLSRIWVLEDEISRQLYESGCTALDLGTFAGYMDAYVAFSSLPPYGYNDSADKLSFVREQLLSQTNAKGLQPQESIFWRYNRTAYDTSAATRSGNVAVFSLLKNRNKITREENHQLDLGKNPLQSQGVFFNVSLPQKDGLETLLKDKKATLILTLQDGWTATLPYTMLTEKAALYDGSRLCFVIDPLIAQAQDHTPSLDGQSFSLVLIIEDCLFYETYGSFSHKQPGA